MAGDIFRHRLCYRQRYAWQREKPDQRASPVEFFPLFGERLLGFCRAPVILSCSFTRKGANESVAHLWRTIRRKTTL